MNKLPQEKRAQILHMLVEGSSLRAVARVANVSFNTVIKLQLEAGEACQAFHDATVRNVRSRRIQCDEIWSFIFAKDKNANPAMKAAGTAGSVWTWTALDSDSKLIVSWLVGGRDAEYAGEFMQDVASRLANRVQLTTDGHKAYLNAVDDAFGIDVDYAQLVKLYSETPDSGPERKYSPGICTGARKHKVTGNPDRAAVSTSHVEKHNQSMRQHMRRFTRLTNAHSKKLENHCSSLALYFVYYNFVRINPAVKMSPAMAAGIETRLWEMKDLLAMVDDYHASKPENSN
jgi:IS1 family transposase